MGDKTGSNRQRSSKATNDPAAIGIYNFAESYRLAAEHLKKAMVRSTHSESPIRFLFYHSIELLLKAFLRARGQDIRSIEKIRHQFLKLKGECQKFGFDFSDEDIQVIELIAKDENWLRARYLVIGFGTLVTLEALEKTSKSISVQVGNVLAEAGVVVRKR